MIFCVLCQNGASHKPVNEESKNCEHTIVPYSVAIKRMAEILIYKANECLSKVSFGVLSYGIPGRVERKKNHLILNDARK